MKIFFQRNAKVKKGKSRDQAENGNSTISNQIVRSMFLRLPHSRWDPDQHKGDEKHTLNEKQDAIDEKKDETAILLLYQLRSKLDEKISKKKLCYQNTQKKRIDTIDCDPIKVIQQ